MTDADLQAVEVPEVGVLRLGLGDALVIRYPGILPEDAMRRLEDWAEATFGRKVPCLVLEDGASIEVLRDATAAADRDSTPMMQRAEQEGIR